MGSKVAQIFINVSSKNWPARFSKFDLEIFFSYRNIKEFFSHFYQIFWCYFSTLWKFEIQSFQKRQFSCRSKVVKENYVVFTLILSFSINVNVPMKGHWRMLYQSRDIHIKSYLRLYLKHCLVVGTCTAIGTFTLYYIDVIHISSTSVKKEN